MQNRENEYKNPRIQKQADDLKIVQLNELFLNWKDNKYL